MRRPVPARTVSALTSAMLLTVAAQSRNEAYGCPSSVGPHAIRCGGITHSLRHGVPEKAISDRADVSPSVLDKHYDRRTQQEKMEQRRDYL